MQWIAGTVPDELPETDKRLCHLISYQNTIKIENRIKNGRRGSSSGNLRTIQRWKNTV